MKKLIPYFVIFILTVMTVSALDNYDAMCQDFGFDDGIAKWIWDGNSWSSDGLSSSTYISGTSESIDIYNGFFATHAVIYAIDGLHLVKGNTGSYEANGMYQVLFCTNNDNKNSNGQDTQIESYIKLQVEEDTPEVPEFNSYVAILFVLIGVALFVKKRN